MSETPIISLRHVAVRFGALEVHKDLNFAVLPGEVVTILGPSGSGKTIILKLIMGLLTQSAGEVIVTGRHVSNIPARNLAEFRRDIGMLFQGAALFDSLTVEDNVAYALREEQEKSETEISRLVRERLEWVGLAHTMQKYPGELSGGQKKRVGLARALASNPKIMLFDEPTTGLDPTSTRRIDELIVRLKNELNITSVVVTHDIQSAHRISDRWVLINGGKVEAAGPVQELVSQSESVIKFITGQWEED